jgi:uncharacterized surface protein with fasciclin (FAS1) repeats
MKIFKILSFTLFSLFSLINFSFAQHNMTAEATTTEMTDDRDIVDIALSSDDHTTLVAALKAAGLVGALQADGPFTVFAPTNAAFDALPEGTVATLLKPENKELLTNILTYHVVAGSLDAASVVKAIQDNNGMASLTALNGGTIKAYLKDGSVYLQDENGNTSKVAVTDLKGSNGVIHVVESVILPASK